MHYLPGPIHGRMRRPANIMGSKPLIKVGGDVYVELIWNSETLDEIDILPEAVPLRTTVLQGTAFVEVSI